MKRKPILCLLALCLAALGGCTSAHTGLDGQTMYTDTYIDLAVSPKNGMAPLRYVNTALDINTDSNITARANVRYAMYGDAAENPVKRHGHVIFASLTDKRAYTFNPESFANSNELELNTVEINGSSDWKEHIMYVEAQGDWFSKVLSYNDRIVPKVWIGKRWSRTFARSTRVIVEYREPLPDCATLDKKTIAALFHDVSIGTTSDQCKRDVDAVFDRANKAFSITNARGVYTPTGEVPADVLPKTPLGAMNTENNIGTASMINPVMSD